VMAELSRTIHTAPPLCFTQGIECCHLHMTMERSRVFYVTIWKRPEAFAHSTKFFVFESV